MELEFEMDGGTVGVGGFGGSSWIVRVVADVADVDAVVVGAEDDVDVVRFWREEEDEGWVWA